MRKTVSAIVFFFFLAVMTKERVFAREMNVENQLIVVYDRESMPEEAESLLEGENSQILMNYSMEDDREMAVVEVTDSSLIEDSIAQYQTIPGVAYVEKDLEMDLFEGDFQDIKESGEENFWWLQRVNLYKAWKRASGMAKHKVKVAVLDTGADFYHEDLKNIVNRDLSREVIKTEEGGYVLAPLRGDGWSDNHLQDKTVNHGTAVTSLLAAEAGNGIGIAGSGSLGDNEGMDLFVVDIFSGRKTSLSRVVAGLNYAASQGAKVINLSLGAEVSLLDSYRLLEETCDNLRAKGISVICAVGNSNREDKGEIQFVPADFDSVMSVIALDKDNQKASDSNYGSLKDISAPGVSLYAAKSGGGYRSVGGSSMATPLVSGIAASIYALDATITNEEVEDIIYKRAIDLYEPGRDNKSGYGLIDADACIEELLLRKGMVNGGDRNKGQKPLEIKGIYAFEEDGYYKAGGVCDGEGTEFRWLLYDLKRKEWRLLTDWSSGNWMAMKIPPKGDYWLRLEARNAFEDKDLTITYRSKGQKPLEIKGIYAFEEDGYYKAGGVCEGEGTEFRWLLYDLKRKEWRLLTDWSSGNWMAMKIPPKGDYWLRLEARNAFEDKDLTITYQSKGQKPLEIKGIYAFEEDGYYKAGGVCEGEDIKFRWLLYDLRKKEWRLLTDWSSGNWMAMKIPSKGDYWLRLEAGRRGENADYTINYKVE